MLRGGQAAEQIRIQRMSAGFTIIELMIATLVFSTIMVVASATVVRYTNAFQRSINQSNTQDVARSVIDDVAEIIQTAGEGQFAGLPPNNGVQGYCIDGVRYSFVTQQMLEPDSGGGANRVLVKEEGQGSGCGNTTTNIATSNAGAELLSKNMRLMDFTIEPLQNGLLYRISIKVAFGDTDLLDNPNDPATIQCKNGPGSQFCAVSSLSTTVKRRL